MSGVALNPAPLLEKRDSYGDAASAIAGAVCNANSTNAKVRRRRRRRHGT